MRSQYQDVADHMLNKMAIRNQKRIDNSINASVGNQNRNSKNIRSGLYDWGAYQMRNMRSNDFAMFGTGFSGNIVGA